jgi:hypothetical protein
MNFVRYDGSSYTFGYLNSDQLMDLTAIEKELYYKQKDIWFYDGACVALLMDMAYVEHFVKLRGES